MLGIQQLNIGFKRERVRMFQRCRSLYMFLHCKCTCFEHSNASYRDNSKHWERDSIQRLRWSDSRFRRFHKGWVSKHFGQWQRDP